MVTVHSPGANAPGLARVRAFGLNRSELYTRQGHPGAAASIRRTTYNSETMNAANSGATLQLIVHRVENGRYRLNLDHVFALADIVEAHRVMEESRAQGKLVVLMEMPAISNRQDASD